MQIVRKDVSDSGKELFMCVNLHPKDDIDPFFIDRKTILKDYYADV
jgi:hypothetical protein